MSNYYWHKPSNAFTIFTVCSVLLMFVLGSWQFSRLEWKENLITTIEAANVADPLTHETIPDDAESFKGLAFRKAKIRGTFLGEHEFHIAARYHLGQLGYHVHQPFRMEDSRVILLNRGWVPADLKEIETRPDSVAEGWQELTVQLRTDVDHTDFTPENQPMKNMWFYKDIDLMSAHAAVKLLPFAADVVGDNTQHTLPVPSSGEIKLRNDHLQYAGTWVGIGIAILMLYVGVHVRRKDA